MYCEAICQLLPQSQAFFLFLSFFLASKIRIIVLYWNIEGGNDTNIDMRSKKVRQLVHLDL